MGDRHVLAVLPSCRLRSPYHPITHHPSPSFTLVHPRFLAASACAIFVVDPRSPGSATFVPPPAGTTGGCTTNGVEEAGSRGVEDRSCSSRSLDCSPSRLLPAATISVSRT